LLSRRFDDREGRPASEEPRDNLRLGNGRGEADSLESLRGRLPQPFERDCKLRPPPVLDELVDLVDDHVPPVPEVPPHPLPRPDRLEGLRGRDQDVRRLRALPPPVLLRRVPVTDVDREAEAPAE